MRHSDRRKKDKVYRKYIEIGIAILCVLLGLVFMFIPFIPLGYIMIIGGGILLTSKIPQLRKIIQKIKKRDKKGRVEQAEKEMKKAEEKIVNEIFRDEDNDNDKKSR